MVSFFVDYFWKTAATAAAAATTTTQRSLMTLQSRTFEVIDFRGRLVDESVHDAEIDAVARVDGRGRLVQQTVHDPEVETHGLREGRATAPHNICLCY